MSQKPAGQCFARVSGDPPKWTSAPSTGMGRMQALPSYGSFDSDHRSHYQHDHTKDSDHCGHSSLNPPQWGAPWQVAYPIDCVGAADYSRGLSSAG